MEQISTKRLSLRKFNNKDIDNMLKNWIADPIIQNRYGEPVYETKDKIKKLLTKWGAEPFRWAIVLKNNGENIGQIGFCRHYIDDRIAEIEYCVGRNFWGKGYATEAVSEIIKYVFVNSNIEKIEAFHQIENPSSGKVLQKVGMTIVLNVKRFEIQGKIPENEICYAITKKEYIKSNINY